ncbi:MAG: AAA-like domain-containing protein [Myxococcales bacterium]|nr:AAA-like domain-containing protein [Myxococcales bacterium]
MTTESPYRAAGTFAGPAYVEREADALLRAAIGRNDRVPYIVAPRQSGKSSLLLRTLGALDPMRYRCAYVDVSQLDLSAHEACWEGLLVEIARAADLPREGVDAEFPEDTLRGWLAAFPWRLVVFLDEVDALVHVPFRDRLFSELRGLFNLRAQAREFERLVLVLAGAASPSQLIEDPMRSPFNVGVEIRLDDLTLARTGELVAFLGRSGATVDAEVAARVHHWTGGSVYLEQAILEGLWDRGGPGRRIGGVDVDATAAAVVERAPTEIHFQNIHKNLADRRPVLAALRAWLAGRAIDPGLMQSLRISGLSGEAPYRNAIYRHVFDGDGPLALIPRPAEPEAPTRPAPPEAVRGVEPDASEIPESVIALVRALFCGEAAPYGPYTLPDELPEAVVPGIVYRFVLVDSDRQRVSLQLYHGLASIGGALWTREVRVLTRVSWRQHPALPTILGGAYVDEHDLAFVLTTAAPYRLSEVPNTLIARDRGEALRQLALLAQGLAVLHEQGITHRNLHPGTVEFIPGDEERYGLRITRFEMSAMISNLARHQVAHERLLGEQLRRLYLVSDAAAVAPAFCPPERARWLFGEEVAQPEGDRSDVYSLGVFAWFWLVHRGDEAAAALTPERSLEGVRRLNQRMRSSLEEQAADVPPRLRELLRRMLAPEPHERPSIFDVLEALAQDYGRMVAGLTPTVEGGTWFVGFMPVESEKTIYRWGWIDQDPRTDTGLEELRGFLARELGDAELLYCADGFAAYRGAQSKREREAMASARYVLVGRQAYWFCDLYRESGGRSRRVEQILLIKYVVHHHRAWRLEATPLRRSIPGDLRFVPVWADRRIEVRQIVDEGQSWVPLLESVRHDQSTPTWLQDMESALNFLLAFRRAELEARVFPYTLAEASGGATVELALDLPRDRKYKFADTLRSLYFEKFRLAMGRLFEGLDGEGPVRFAVFEDRRGRPDYQTGAVGHLFFDRRLDDDTVRMRSPRGTRDLPENGWIRPDDDQGSFVQLQRQADAVQQLLQARTLLHQLHHPAAVRGFRARWRDVGGGLEGRGAQVVQDMLSCEPFYALHGPPGSGKTTVASTAVAAYLRLDPGQRVLVSSQSHNALDNLGVRMLAQCGGDVMAVRVASQGALADEKIHPRMQALLAENQAGALVRRVIQTCTRAQEDGALANGRPLDDRLREVLREWAEQAPRVELELRDRIRRGANLVFATTGTCSERSVATASANGTYDWVIVEEAARAWPTELAQPLVRGLRWTLIGDHYQLPAFDEIAVDRFLERCADSDDEELRAHGERADVYHSVFRLFGNLFDERAARRREGGGGARLSDPLDELDLQFRMHPDICRIVARAFYRERVMPETGELKHYEEGWLKTHASARRAHTLQHPRRLRGRAVIWLDTQHVPDCNDVRAWRNAGEAEVIRRLLAEMDPTPPQGDERFALLTPYNAQIEELRLANLPGWVGPRIYTTDGFQGREADIVVVSLVRSVQRDGSRPEANIGHLVSPNRVNVLLSRARKLLVVVGRIDHFERQANLDPTRTDLRYWRTVVDEFRRQDSVVDAAELLGGEDGW